MNVKPRTLEKMQHFVGKVCSIFTGPLNRNFDETRAREHFVVRVEEIDCDGLWGTHPYNHTVSFFLMDAIKLITEEIVLDPSNPEHAKMIQEFQEKTGKPVVSDVSPHLAPVVGVQKAEPPEPLVEEEFESSAFIDIKNMTTMVRQAKQSFQAKDMHRSLNS
jgi:hypothetical protein